MDVVTDAAAAAGPWVLLLGTLVAAIRAVFTGALVPRPQVDELRTQWQARLDDLEQRLAESHEREQLWQRTAEREAEARRVDSAQLGELIPVARTTLEILRTVGVAAGGAPPTVPRGLPLRPRGGDGGATD